MKLLNRSEELTFDILSNAVANEARVFPKVRIADAVQLNGSGLSDALFSYGLQAHFDFVVTTKDYDPLFAVEFDGPLHRTSQAQKERDAKKDAICKHREFPLLRINSRYIDRKYRGMDLLSYFVDVWFLADAFYDAQKNGTVPYDEIFDPTLILSNGSSGKRWPYWLSWEAQMEIQAFQKNGLIHSYIPCHWTGADSNDAYRSVAWLEVQPKRFVFTQTGMRHQMFPAYFDDVLFQISIFDLRKLVGEFLADPRHSVGWDTLKPVLDEYQSKYSLMSCSGTGTVDRSVHQKAAT